jgi:dTDP-4-amino-4,6-dideoxygalactose transaminase
LNRKKYNHLNKPSFKIPFFAPWITNDDKNAIRDALESTLLTDGPKLREFEFEFSKYTSAKYARGVSNATSALHLSLLALGIGKGDEVIVPDLTFVATANAVIHAGAVPVFADVEINDMNISVDSIEENVTSRTKAILPVHLAGNACNMTKIMKVARSKNFNVIEDCAHAIGTKYEKKHVGTFGDVGCFSFYPTKNITTIEGGMVTTNSEKLAEYITTARNHGITKTLSERYSHGRPWEYDISESGYNYRLDEIRSSLGLSQLKRIKKLNHLRKKAFEYYNSKLENINGIITPTVPKNTESAHHLYIIKIERGYGISRDKLFQMFQKRGISTTVHYKPLHQFIAFKKYNKGILKNTVKLYNEIISLPFYPNITRKEQDLVVKCIRENNSQTK